MIPTQTKHALTEAFDVAYRRRWRAILVFLVVLTTVTTLVAFLPDVYESKATLLVERQQVPEEFIRSTVTSAVDRRLQGITQTLMSRPRLTELIERFGLYPELRNELPMDEIVDLMRPDIQVQTKGIAAPSPAAKSNVIAFAISYKGREPRKVAAVVNELASWFIEEDLKVRER
ncbi:MAG: GumC family protein, partial [Candidatus Binatia bacterium]